MGGPLPPRPSGSRHSPTQARATRSTGSGPEALPPAAGGRRPPTRHPQARATRSTGPGPEARPPSRRRPQPTHSHPKRVHAFHRARAGGPQPAAGLPSPALSARAPARYSLDRDLPSPAPAPARGAGGRLGAAGRRPGGERPAGRPGGAGRGAARRSQSGAGRLRDGQDRGHAPTRSPRRGAALPLARGPLSREPLRAQRALPRGLPRGQHGGCAPGAGRVRGGDPGLWQPSLPRP